MKNSVVFFVVGSLEISMKDIATFASFGLVFFSQH